MSLKKFISLEQQAIATAPIDCNPKLWKRYVDDILKSLRGDSWKLSQIISTE